MFYDKWRRLLHGLDCQLVWGTTRCYVRPVAVIMTRELHKVPKAVWIISATPRAAFIPRRVFYDVSPFLRANCDRISCWFYSCIATWACCTATKLRYSCAKAPPPIKMCRGLQVNSTSAHWHYMESDGDFILRPLYLWHRVESTDLDAVVIAPRSFIPKPVTSLI
jgi:hypothetical protein